MSKVVKAVGNVVKGVVNAVVGVVKAVVNVVSSVVNFVASPFMGLLGGAPDMPDAGSQAQQQQGVLIQRQGSNESIPVIYGLRKVGGIVTYAETGADNNKYLWVAYAFAEGCVEGLHELFIDDFQLSAETIGKLNGGQIVEVADGKYKGRCVMYWSPGQMYVGSNTPTGTNALMFGGSANGITYPKAPSWQPSMCYNGVAVLFARYEWKKIETQADQEANPYSGNIPQIQASILGRKVVSLLATANPDPSQFEYDQVPGPGGYRGGLERYSTNPAECLLDYLRNPRYGKGLKNADIDWASFRIAAAKYNQQIQYTNGTRGPILTTNAVIFTSQTLFQNVKLLLQGCRSYLPYVQGKYKLKVEDAGNETDITSGSATIVATFNRNNIHGEISYTGIERSNKYSHVELTWVDPDQKYSNQVVVYPETEIERQTYITADGGRENALSATFPTITNRQMALDMARLLFYKSRYQETCSFKASSQAFELEPGDCIRIQSNILNFGTTPWRIINITLNDDYTFSLNCVRNPDWLYPYTKAGEADRVLPPFLPIGGGTILPSFNTDVSLGLVPPNWAYNLGGGNTGTNPPATVVDGTNGGGVGGSTSTTNLVTTPPIILPPSDAVDFGQAIVTPITEDTVTIELRWLQPLNAMYEALDIYYKASPERNYRKDTIATKPGVGKEITWKSGVVISAAPYNNYDFVARVKYVTGEYSSRVTKIQVAVGGLKGVTITEPTEYFDVTYDGWTLPLVSSVSATNDTFGTVDIRPLYTVAPTFTDPRSLRLTLRQLFTIDNPVNYEINGVEVFYKPSNQTYWRSRRLTALNLVPGDDFTVDMGGTADTQTVLGSPGSYSTYDFILRPLYKNGQSSSKQNRYMGVNIENTTGNITYSVQRLTENVSAYPFQTYEQGVQSGAIADVRDSKIGLYSILDDYAGRTSGGFTLSAPAMRVFVRPPDVSVRDLYRGFKVYLRARIPGVEATVTEYIWKSTVLNGEGGTAQYLDIPLNTIGYNKSFDIIAVPLVYYGGQVIEGRYCQYGTGYINNAATSTGYPTNGNWAPSFNIKETPTDVALFNIASFIPQPEPVVNVVAWETYKHAATETYAGISQPGGLGTTPYLNQFYRITYSMAHISNFNEVQIYRRRKHVLPTTYINTYYALSRWEKITVTETNTTATSVRVLLRPPPSIQEYTSAYTYTSPSYKFPPPAPLSATHIRTLPSLSIYDEFIFVVKANGTVSKKAIYLKGTGLSGSSPAGFGNLLSNVVISEIDWPTGLGTEPPVGWEKSISEARTPPSLSTWYYSTGIPVTNASGVVTAAISYPTITGQGSGPY